MTPEEERIDKVLDSLSLARTALDDPSGIPQEEVRNVSDFGGRLTGWSLTEEAYRLYAIDKIDDAMRLLNPEKEEPSFALMVCQDGVSMSRYFDPEDEAIDAIGEAINIKEKNPDAVVTLVVGRVRP